jgi:3-oxoacyl-[acyl-carrier-protein] synthase II
MDQPRVYITGVGAIGPCGLTAPASWQAVRAGRSGIAAISGFDTEGWPVRIAGEVTGYEPGDHFDRRQLRRYERFIQYALLAAREAITSAALDPEAQLGDRAGVYVGSGIGGTPAIAHNAQVLADRGHRRISPFFIPRSLSNMAGGHIAMQHGARGPNLCIATACASGNNSIGEAARLVRSGEVDLMLAGGTEGSLFDLGVAGFMGMKALSKRNDAPEQACRPFDADRDGFVMAEGAGVVVLESEAHMRARGARPLAEVLGYGVSNDAHHITAPPPRHAGAARAMRLALRSAGLQPEDVDYINAHGTSTPANDRAETEAIRDVFGVHADRLAVSSTKSVTGHLLGAAGGIEAVLCSLALQDGFLPPTINLDTPGEGCDLDYVPHVGRSAPLSVVMSNAFGFGGQNAVIVLGHPDR